MNVPLGLPCRGIGTASLLLLLLLPLPVEAATASLPAPPRPATGAERHSGAPSMVLVGWSLQKLWSPFESTFNNRRRMIQLATIGMCIGLYILMRK